MAPEEEDDPTGRMRAEMDQAKEGSKELAGTLWTFYRALVGAGFGTEQAFALTRDWLDNVMNS